MKNKLILLLLSISYITVFSQDTITYNFKEKKFEDLSFKKLKRNSKLEVYVKNYNPFVYTLISQTKVKDNSSKLPKFITGAINMGQTLPSSALFSPRISPAKKVDSTSKDDDATKRLESIKEFSEKYFVAIKIYSEMRKPILDCDLVKNLLDDNFDKKDLLNYYEEAFNSYNRGNPSREINKYGGYFESGVLDKIIEINLFLTYLKDYLKDIKNCTVLVKKINIKGEAMTLSLKFTPRDEAKSFSTPYKIVEKSKKFEVKQSFKVHFSSGIMLTRNLKKDFFVQKIDSTQFKISKEDRGEYLSGITALAHIKSGDDKMSFLIGSGINIEGTIHLLTGISYPINKINLNFGYGWVLTDELSDGLSKDLIFKEAPTLKTKKILNGNIWFGLSYNF